MKRFITVQGQQAEVLKAKTRGAPQGCVLVKLRFDDGLVEWRSLDVKEYAQLKTAGTWTS